jgi:hypothetical protein
MMRGEYQTENRRHLGLARAWLFDWMEHTGVIKLVLPFDGSCDEGCFEQPAAYAADGTEVAVDFNTIATSVNRWNVTYTYPRAEGVASGTKQYEPAYTWQEGKPMDLAELLEAVGLDATDEYDWVNNDGGYGEVLFCLYAGTIGGIEYGRRRVIVDMNVRETISHNATYQA